MGTFQTYLAITSIGASTLRNQGAPDVIKVCRLYLSKLDLSNFNVEKEALYLEKLNSCTEQLRLLLPDSAQHWGTARKALNIFLRNVYYHTELKHMLGKNFQEEWLEIPLDNIVAKKLRTFEPTLNWKSIKELTEKESLALQNYARTYAQTQGITRAVLDMCLWTELRK